MGKFIMAGGKPGRQYARATGEARRAARKAGSKREARRAYAATVKAHGYGRA